MINWAKEARDLPSDPTSGARLFRLSGSSIRTENIYCEAPRATADGRRFASMRYIDELLSPTKALLCHDLETKLTCLLDAHVEDSPISPAWGGSVYYRRGTTLMRASLDTCTVEPVLDMSKMPRCWQLMSVTPDEGRLLYTGVVQDEPEGYNLIEIDLRTKVWRKLWDKTELVRLNASYNPVTGKQILVMSAVWVGVHRSAAFTLTDADGRGGRVVFSAVHHYAWLGDTGSFAGLLNFDPETLGHRPENPNGELMIYSASGGPPRFIPTPQHVFLHLSASRCGRYIVSESLESGFSGPVPLVVVNVVTGKYRTLVSDCHAPAAGDCGRQAKPYFTADSRHVIYTGEPDGVVNVFAAQVPSGFLESLS